MNRESADQDPLVRYTPPEVGRCAGTSHRIREKCSHGVLHTPPQGQTSPLISWKPLRGSIYRGYSIRGSFLVSRFIPVLSEPPSRSRFPPSSWQLSAYRGHAFSHYTSLRRFTMRHLYIREDSATDLRLRNLRS